MLSSRFSENVISNIKETNTCRNNDERNNLIHDLKIQLNLSIDKDRIANGHININTCTIMYLREYERVILIKPNEINALTKPSKENKLKLAELFTIFKFSIKVEKQILVLNNASPTFLIAREIEDIIKIRQ